MRGDFEQQALPVIKASETVGTFGVAGLENPLSVKGFAKADDLFNGDSPACRDGSKESQRLPGFMRRRMRVSNCLLNAVSGKGESI